MRARLAAALVSLAACGDDVGPGLEERTHVYAVGGGTFVELRVDLTAASAMTVIWSADAPLAWQVHSHPLGSQEVHVDGPDGDVGGAIEFAAPAWRVYGVQWSNFRDSVTTLEVTLELPDDAVLLSW